MKTRTAVAGLMTLAIAWTTFPPAAIATTGIVAQPHRVAFGPAPVGCVIGGDPACPTALVTITNESRETVLLDSFSTCSRVVRHGCESTQKHPGCCGMLDFPAGCFVPLAPGTSCSVTLVAVPDKTGPANGILLVRSKPEGDIVLRVPLSVVGT
jgi:hypothetical protein